MPKSRLTGMGYKTNLHYHEVAKNMVQYNNSFNQYEYHSARSSSDNYKSYVYGTAYTDYGNYATKVNATNSIMTYIPTVLTIPPSNGVRSISKDSA